MNTTMLSLKFLRIFAAGLLSLFTVSACTFSLPTIGNQLAASPTPVIQVVTHLVTRVVSRIVEVPVTVTPTPTPLYTFTPSLTPFSSLTPGPPGIEILGYTDCLYGPAPFFLYKTSLPASASMEVVGRNLDGSWIAVEEEKGWDPCWIPATRASFKTGSIENVSVIYPTLPHSFWYKPPNATAHRDGTGVIVSWKAVGMAEYDYRGYLIIAWVCQAGEHIYLPVSIAPPYAENTGSLSTTIKDEPGCREPSSAYIYTAEKRGYSGEMIFWPAY